MDYKERRAKRLERYKRLLIIQKLFSVAILASIAVSAGMFNIIKTPKVILDIINYDTELVVNVEVDPNESKVKEESLKLVVKDGYEKHNYPLRFGKNTIYQADMKYNWEYRLDVLADWGMGQGTIISKRYTTRKDIPRPGKRISKESLHVNSLTYISNYGLVGAASIVENDNITTTYSELISFNIKDKDGKSFEGKVPFNEMVNQDIFFVPIANLDLENSLDVKYTFSGKYINSDWTEETFKSNDIPINKIETMTYNQVPDSYISVSSQADSLNYIEINSGKLYGPKPMIKTDNNVYRINVDNLEKAKQTAYVSYYKKDGKIYLYASIRNLYIIEEPQNLITEVPKYLSSSKEIILEYIAERNIVSMDTLIYRNGVQIYSSIKDTPVTGKRYIKSINYNYTAGDRVSVLFYEHQDSPSSLLKQYIVDFSKSESFVSNTTNLASLSFNVFADNISEGNYEAVIVDKDGVCSAPKKLSKLNATRYQSEKLEINTVGYNRSYIHRIEAGKKIVFSSAIKYVLPATNSSINPLSGNFDRSIQVKTSEVFNSLDYNTNSIIKYKLYEKDFDGTIQPVSGGEDTKPYTTNISVNSKDFSLTEKKVYFAKIYYADSTDGLEHFLYDTQDFAVRDFVIITDVKDISKKYDLLKYDMKFNIFSSESKTMNIVLKDMEQVTEEIPYQATAGMKKTSYIAEYIFQGTGSNIVRDNMKISFKDYSEEYDYQVQYVRFSANASGTEPVSLNLSYGYSDATYINRLYCVVETETGTNTIELASGESIVLQDNYNLENTGAQAGKMIYIYVDYKDGRTGVLEAKTVISVW